MEDKHLYPFFTFADCGMFNLIAGRIAGGTDAGANEYPYHVLIALDGPGKGNDRECNGVVISDKWVMTSEKCVSPGNR